ncbi:MAG: hypothetical protein LBB38_01160 [Puniceicoccales bacterium]|nr:hypothetical protein [Puniceicoccales bacterium]
MTFPVQLQAFGGTAYKAGEEPAVLTVLPGSDGGEIDGDFFALLERVRSLPLNVVIGDVFFAANNQIADMSVATKTWRAIMGLAIVFACLVNFLIGGAFARVDVGDRIIERDGATYAVANEVSDILPETPEGDRVIGFVSSAATALKNCDGCRCSVGPQQYTYEEAVAIGMLFTTKEKFFLLAHPDVLIVPYFVPYPPMHNLQDAISCEQNLAGGIPDNLEAYDEIFAERILPEVNRHNARIPHAEGVFRCPVCVGMSMGGANAHAIGVKHQRMSIAFNPLGHGIGVQKYIGLDAVAIANGEQARSHLSFVTRGDYVSCPLGASPFVYRAPPGRRFIVPNLTGETSKDGVHNGWSENFVKFVESRRGAAEG